MRTVIHAVAAAAALLVLAGAAAAQPAQAPAPSNVIAVQLSEYKYSPAQIDLNHGQSYVLHLTNAGSKSHNFVARDLFQAVTLTPESAAKVHDGTVELAKDESADIAFSADKPGTYEMHCTHPLHAMLGMKGQIVIH